MDNKGYFQGRNCNYREVIKGDLSLIYYTVFKKQEHSIYTLLVHLKK